MVVYFTPNSSLIFPTVAWLRRRGGGRNCVYGKLKCSGRKTPKSRSAESHSGTGKTLSPPNIFARPLYRKKIFEFFFSEWWIL